MKWNEIEQNMNKGIDAFENFLVEYSIPLSLGLYLGIAVSVLGVIYVF